MQEAGMARAQLFDSKMSERYSLEQVTQLHRACKMGIALEVVLRIESGNVVKTLSTVSGM